jgi:hypothetical protein
LKFFNQIIATVFAVAILLSCNHKKNPDKIILITPKIKKEIEAKFVGKIETRRTWVGIQSIYNEKERVKYVAEQEKSSPVVIGYSPQDSTLIKQFQRLQLIKGGVFLEARFKTHTKQKATFVDSSERNFSLIFFNDSLTGNAHFKIFFSNDSIDVDTKNKPLPLQKLQYRFLDVMPGGNKELVFLNEYYIMNGYNFDLEVYEIKYN